MEREPVPAARRRPRHLGSGVPKTLAKVAPRDPANPRLFGARPGGYRKRMFAVPNWRPILLAPAAAPHRPTVFSAESLPDPKPDASTSPFRRFAGLLG